MNTFVAPASGMRFVRCKSLPRSGHNFLSRLLRLYFHPHIRYCEPYRGRCCHKQPCERPCRYRLHKSHDFELKDARAKEGCLIQYRAPIPALHSHYLFDVVDRNLEASVRGFAGFAEANTPYYARFFLKWVSNPRPQDLVIRYEDLVADPDKLLRQAIRFVQQSRRPIFGTRRLQRCASRMRFAAIIRLSKMNCAGCVLLAKMPPTRAAATNTTSGRWRVIHDRTCSESRRSTLRSAVRTSQRSAASLRTKAEPTMPRCPATQTEALARLSK